MTEQNAFESVKKEIQKAMNTIIDQQFPNAFVCSIIRNAVCEFDLNVKKTAFEFEEIDIAPFGINKEGMEKLMSTQFSKSEQELVCVPDMDRIDYTKLYSAGEVPGGRPDKFIKKFDGEMISFRSELELWLSGNKKGLLLYSYSAKELRNILSSKTLGEFEFDWLLFQKFQIVVTEVTAASKNIKDAILWKLQQVMNKTLPMLKILIWYLLAKDERNFSQLLEEKAFNYFVAKYLKIIVLIASASFEDIHASLTSILDNDIPENNDLQLLLQKNSSAISLVGKTTKEENQRPRFVRLVINNTGSLEVTESDVSPLIENQRSEELSSIYNLDAIKYLTAAFALGYFLEDDKTSKIYNFQNEALGPDFRFLGSQKIFVNKLKNALRKSRKKHKILRISEKLTVILSPQQLKILEDDPRHLLVRGEPGAGKTVLLLAKALECALKDVKFIYFCLPETKHHLREFIFNFRKTHAETFGQKFYILTDPSTDFFELSRKPYRELHDSVLLIDEFYFDCSEKLKIKPSDLNQISSSIFPHFRNVWITSVAITFFRYSMHLMKEYLPLELFSINPLNVQFRNSVHIATLCTNYHHRGGLKAFASSYVPGVFTSSEIKVHVTTFREKNDVHFLNLNPKYKNSRWLIIFCDETDISSWTTYLETLGSDFSDKFVIPSDGSPTMCDFSGAEVFSVVLIIDRFFTKNQETRNISEAMYKLAASRAQYELQLFVHADMNHVQQEFSGCCQFQLDVDPDEVLVLPKEDPDGSRFATTLYNLARGYLNQSKVDLFVQTRYPGLTSKLFKDYVAEERNRKVFILLLRHMGLGIINFLLDCSRSLTSEGKITFVDSDKKYHTIFKGNNINILLNIYTHIQAEIFLVEVFVEKTDFCCNFYHFKIKT